MMKMQSQSQILMLGNDLSLYIYKLCFDRSRLWIVGKINKVVSISVMLAGASVVEIDKHVGQRNTVSH